MSLGPYWVLRISVWKKIIEEAEIYSVKLNEKKHLSYELLLQNVSFYIIMKIKLSLKFKN